jgi:hypothetical protein
VGLSGDVKAREVPIMIVEIEILVVGFFIYWGLHFEIARQFKALNKRIDSIVTRVYNLDGHGPIGQL